MVKYELLTEGLYGIFDDLSTLKALETKTLQNAQLNHIATNIKALHSFISAEINNKFDEEFKNNLGVCITICEQMKAPNLLAEQYTDQQTYIFRILESLLQETFTIQDFLTPIK